MGSDIRIHKKKGAYSSHQRPSHHQKRAKQLTKCPPPRMLVFVVVSESSPRTFLLTQTLLAIPLSTNLLSSSVDAGPRGGYPNCGAPGLPGIHHLKWIWGGKEERRWKTSCSVWTSEKTEASRTGAHLRVTMLAWSCGCDW